VTPGTAGHSAPGTRMSVLRLASVFEPPPGEPMRVGYDPVGGMQTHTAELTRCLDALGLTQTVLTSPLGGRAGRWRFGEQAVIVRAGLRLPALRQLWAPPALAAALRLPLRPGVVHAHAGEDIAVLPTAWAAAARHRCPLVITIHCSLRHTFAARGPRAAALALAGGALERALTARADAVIALTATAAAALCADGVPADRVHVIPSGFSPALFSPPRPDPFPWLPRPRLAYAGRLVAGKGVGALLGAFARCQRAASLVVVGDGPQRAALERRAASLRAPVHFTGYLPHRLMPGVLQHCDVFVLPSSFEELGSVLIEAMACGLPVVASRAGGIPSLVRHGENGLLAGAGEVAELTAAIGLLLARPGLAARLSAAARLTAREYAWPVLAERVAAVYAQAAVPGRCVAAGAADGRHAGDAGGIRGGRHAGAAGGIRGGRHTGDADGIHGRPWGTGFGW
jgi:glycosyltransferase involved in cell wall biosynthesis